MPDASDSSNAGTPKGLLKRLASRLMRPGLVPVHERIEAARRDVAGIHDRLDRIDADRHKYESELEYWRWLIKKGGSEKGFGGPFERVFAKWTRDRIVKMGAFLSLPAAGEPGCIDDWARERSAIEIGAGPFPLIASVRHGWKRCAAVDPIARGYVEEGLIAEAAQHIVYVAARGEDIPLPSASADLVVIENCLDHVRDPEQVLREITRLLVPGGLLWIFVDLSNHVDHMHPHAMNEEKVRRFLAPFEIVRDEVTSHKAHPEAYGSYCGLLRRPIPVLRPAQDVRSNGHGGENVRSMVEVRPVLSASGSAAGRPQN